MWSFNTLISFICLLIFKQTISLEWPPKKPLIFENILNTVPLSHPMSCVMFLVVSQDRFHEERLALTKATCLIPPMMNHLKLFHPKSNAELMRKNGQKEKPTGEKRKAMDENEEMESGTVPLFDLRTSKQRRSFKLRFLVIWFETLQMDLHMICMMPEQRETQRNFDDGGSGSSTLKNCLRSGFPVLFKPNGSPL